MATLEYASIVLESSDVGVSSWVPFAGEATTASEWEPAEPMAGGLDPLLATARASSAAGVEYPLGPLPLIGTTIDEGSTASFDLNAALVVSGPDLDALLDDGATDGVRLIVHVEASPRVPQAGQPFSDLADVTNPTQLLEPAITNLTVEIAPPTGAPEEFDSSDEPALGELEPGDDPIEVGMPYVVEVDTARGEESAGAYIDRLRSTTQPLMTATVNGTFESGPLEVTATTSTTLRMPILKVDGPTEPLSITGGSSLWESVQLMNVGSTATDSITVAASIPDLAGSATPDQVLDPGNEAWEDIEYEVPAGYAEGSVGTTVEITWTDADLNEYGPVEWSSDAWVTNGATGAPYDLSSGGPQPSIPAFGVELVYSSAADDTSIASMALVVDGEVESTDSTEPYEFEWDTSELEDGLHQYQVRATDTSSNVSTSAPISVTIENGLPSDRRVGADAESGRLAVDEAALLLAQAAFEPQELPGRYQSEGPAADGPGALTQVMRSWGDLDAGTQEDIVDVLEDSSTDTSRWSSGAGFLLGAGDFASHCSTQFGCSIETENFKIFYAIDPATDRAVPMDDEWQLAAGPDLETDCGACNGVPDWIDRLAYGFEQARVVYSARGYPVPGDVLVFVEPSVQYLGPIGYDLNGRGLSLGERVWVPYEGNVAKPITTARHEYYHSATAAILFPEWSDFAEAVGLFGTLVFEQTHDPRWWLEATAEWGAHQAEAFEPDDWEDEDFGGVLPTEYATNLRFALGQPEASLAYSDGAFREYGAFIFPEFLEEWAAGADAFRSDEPLLPDPQIVESTWEEIATDQTELASLQGIDAALLSLDPSTSLEELLPDFWRAAYLLNATRPGVLRDPALEDWRTALDVPGPTAGDPDLTGGHTSTLPRPRRQAVELTEFLGFEDATVEPGGASYIEFKLPGSGGRYRVLFGGGDIDQLRATTMAFESYPEPCVTDSFVDLDSEAPWVDLELPDSCTSLTVQLSHIDPIAGWTVSTWVGVQPLAVTESFERTQATGWGTMDVGRQWQTGDANSMMGTSVADGRGIVHLDDGRVRRIGWQPWSYVSDLLAVGRFTDCGTTTDAVTFDFGGRFIVTSGGSLRPPLGGGVTLEDFDACAPWFLRAVKIDDQYEVRVWQATDTEPTEPGLVIGVAGPDALEIMAWSSDSSPNRNVEFDWIDFDLEATG